ncbi:MAG: TolB family protein, partial [bacterium]
MAYADDAAGQFNLTVKSVSGGPPLRLTSYAGQTVRRVVWHPDGESLFFQADAQGNESAQIYRMPAGGGDVQPLTETPGTWYWLALGEPFSPDGGRLAYVGNDRDPRNQDVLIRDLETDRIDRVYVDGGQVYVGYWSPDGVMDQHGPISRRLRPRGLRPADRWWTGEK